VSQKRDPFPSVDLLADGAASPPRSNGELTFEAPWEARAFGMTLALVEAGVFEQEEFRARLIAEISAWEANHAAGESYRYYERWLAALEQLMAAKGISDPAQLDALAEQLANRPAGHDHTHPEG